MRGNEDACLALITHEDDQHACLSSESRRNFDIIRSMISSCETMLSEGSNNEGDHQPKTSTDDVVPVPSVSLKRRKIDEMAEITMQKVQEEISHWEQGIKEMEYLLSLASADDEHVGSSSQENERGAHFVATMHDDEADPSAETGTSSMAADTEDSSDTMSPLESNDAHPFHSTPLH